jgi:D-alanyl-lipoteichoic acid acyltransferase DltB (MBOAT superfamily)
MVFNSLQYALFLPLVLLLYWRLGRRRQNILLLVASYLFYGLWDWRFLPLMMLSTATDYQVGLWLERTTDDRRRARIFAISLVVNLGILGFFKYANFFLESGAGSLHAIGIDVESPTWQILLPIGISFYTFHGISYTFDVYRREIAASRSALDFAVFVAFFPQLVAGPIGRAKLQLPQFQQARVRPADDGVRSAVFLILLGLFKKVAIADALAPAVDRAFTGGGAGWVTLLIGMYSFALQIYGDFSGYSDMARGSARLLGIELPSNFEQPYLSRNATEFWRRWHISLSTWLRDYLYVPLGGNRGSSRRVYRNLLLTMLLGGLWHGAAWTFVIWGAIHGCFLASHKWWRSRRPLVEEPSRAVALWCTIATFHVVCGAWIFFRSPDLRTALRYCEGILTLRPGPVDVEALAVLIPAALVTLFIDIAQRRAREHEVVVRWPAAVRGSVYAMFGLAIVVFSGAAPVPFIYFQF